MNVTENFKKCLNLIDITPDDKESGFVYIDALDEINNKYEYLACKKAKKFKVDAVYFKRFSTNNQSNEDHSNTKSIPLVYIYDYSNKVLSDDDKKDIALYQKNIWCSLSVPLIYVFTKTEIYIINSFNKPSKSKINDNGEFEFNFLEKIEIAAGYLDNKRFSVKSLDNGSFWNNPQNSKEFSKDNTAYKTLLNELNRLSKKFIESGTLKENTSKKIIVMSILIKYLEVRKDNDGNSVFSEGYFNSFSGSEDTFVSVIKNKSKIVDLFEDLCSPNKFNGDIFSLTEDEKIELIDKDLSSLGEFISGDLKNEQYSLFQLYDFNYIPIELISNFYEQFTNKTNGCVYTPPYLVDLLVDECIPLGKNTSELKAYDPACGSGVYLVKVFNRLLDNWIINNTNYDEKKLLEYGKKLLRENIWGSDIDELAVRLTIFSLCLALCERLSPRVIGENLRFEKYFNKNILNKDFFVILDSKELSPDFDLIIGNPPFESKLNSLSAKKIEKEYINIRSSVSSTRVVLPDNQISLLFFEQGFALLKEKGQICLLQPSGPFLYNLRETSEKFRDYLFNNFFIYQIFDFTPLREVLFESAKVAVIAVFAIKEQLLTYDLKHIIFRRTKTSKEKIMFELDHYDFNIINKNDTKDKKCIFNANLIGGGRLVHLLDRLSKIKKLSDIARVFESNGGIVSEGIVFGKLEERNRLRLLLSKKNKTDLEANDLINLQNKFSHRPDYKNYKYLPSARLDENSINYNELQTVDEEYFVTPREKIELFLGKKLLIRETAENNTIIVKRVDKDLIFNDQIFSFTLYKNNDDRILNEIKSLLKKEISYFCAIIFSGKYLISRPKAFQKIDIMSVPFPDDESELQVSKSEEIIINDVLEYLINYRLKGEKAIIYKDVTDKQLREFGIVFTETLNTIYDNFHHLDPMETDHYIVYPFSYNNKDFNQTIDRESLNDYLNKIMIKHSSNLKINRILKIYEKNQIILIKPKELKYWLKSIAIRDADDVLSDMVKWGY